MATLLIVEDDIDTNVSPLAVIALYSRYPVKQSSSTSRMISGVSHSSSPAQALEITKAEQERITAQRQTLLEKLQ